MENMLLSFQTDLGSISTEIMALQQQSVQMNLKLQNRQAVKAELSQFVHDMVIPEAMIRSVMSFLNFVVVRRYTTTTMSY